MPSLPTTTATFTAATPSRPAWAAGASPAPSAPLRPGRTAWPWRTSLTSTAGANFLQSLLALAGRALAKTCQLKDNKLSHKRDRNISESKLNYYVVSGNVALAFTQALTGDRHCRRAQSSNRTRLYQRGRRPLSGGRKNEKQVKLNWA